MGKKKKHCRKKGPEELNFTLFSKLKKEEMNVSYVLGTVRKTFLFQIFSG